MAFVVHQILTDLDMLSGKAGVSGKSRFVLNTDVFYQKFALRSFCIAFLGIADCFGGK